MDYSLILDDIKQYFQNLIILQYRSSKQNRALIASLVELVFANNLLLQIRDNCLNVETSVGKQLDLLGAWVGIDRYYDAIDLWEKNHVALVNYTNISSDTYEQWQGGFSTYTNFEDNDGGFLMWKEWRDTRTQVNQIGDDYFRQLIRLKIIKNSIPFTNKNIDDAIWKWSNGDVYTTWGVMEVTYHYPAEMHNLFQLAIYKNVLLAPTGCAILTEEY